MFHSFDGLGHLEILTEALKIKSLDEIKAAFLETLKSSPNFDDNQKLAIKLAAARAKQR